MPIHDWSKVDANLFHDFHQAWSLEIRKALNKGMLPTNYTALVVQHSAGFIPNVLSVERSDEAPRGKPRGGAMVLAEPKARHVVQAKKAALASRGNRIVIRHALGEVVAVIEIVSPGNKSGRKALRQFVEKTIDFLDKGVHVSIVDLFRPTIRDPHSIHGAIWDEIEPDEWELPRDRPLTLASHVAADPPRAYVEPVGFGDELPNLPLYLDTWSHVSVPLAATYESAWVNVPSSVREFFVAS